MGGNALKNVEIKRINKNSFEKLKSEVYSILNFYVNKIDTPRNYNNKTDFGDLDIIIVLKPEYKLNWLSYIKDIFKPKDIFVNNNCVSLSYKNHQIDIISVSDDKFITMVNFMNFNDLGNLLGRLAHSLGMKYGQDGLVYPVYVEDAHVDNIVVCTDPEKMMKFIDVDYNQYKEGFNDLTDIFEFVAKSKYFDWRLFQFDQLNKINRDRNKKRKTYITFLDWLEENKHRDGFESTFDKDKSYFNEINKYFPEAKLKLNYRKIVYHKARNLYCNSLFDGGELIRRFNIDPKDIANIKKAFEDVLKENEIDLQEFLLRQKSPEAIYEFFGNYYNIYYRKPTE